MSKEDQEVISAARALIGYLRPVLDNGKIIGFVASGTISPKVISRLQDAADKLEEKSKPVKRPPATPPRALPPPISGGFHD